MTPEDKDKITDDIMSAFDEMAEEGADEGSIAEGEIEEPEPVEPVEADDEGEQEAEEEPEPEEAAEDEEVEEVEVNAEADRDPGDEQPEEPETDEEEGEEQQAEYSPAVQAFLDRHEGDLAAALQTAVEIQSMLGRRNTEQGEMSRRITQLEAELVKAQAFQAEGVGLTAEQSEWVEQAISSEQPGAFVQSAVAAGEFDLARAVCDAWGSDGDAYSALRTRQMVDQAEHAAYQAQLAQQPPPEFSRDELFGMISQQVPDFGDYYGEMTEIVTQLGREHPMVAAANSPDPNEAAVALIDLYKIARTRQTRVSEARQQHQEETKQRSLAAKQQARVSSASSRTSTEEPPPSVRIGPGLTLEELDAAFAAE